VTPPIVAEAVFVAAVVAVPEPSATLLATLAVALEPMAIAFVALETA